VGYTPYLIGGVWYGYEYPSSLSGASSGICQKIWDDVMDKLHKKGIEYGGFISSDNVISAEYCLDSGKLVGEACKKDPRGDRVAEGYFVRGTEPKERCDCHVLVKYDTTEGGVANSECPFYDTEYVALIKVERIFPTQIFVSDAQYVYKELPKGIMPETSPRLPYFNNVFGKNEYGGISYGDEQYNRYCRAHFDYWKWKEQNS
jgi:hypothetical protein